MNKLGTVTIPMRFPPKKKKSSKLGNWPWFPRAEIESSTLNHFLCSVTMHEGISTNPLSCHGFRSWTWVKTAWDIPALCRHRTPFDLFGSWTSLGELQYSFPFSCISSRSETQLGLTNCGKRPSLAFAKPERSLLQLWTRESAQVRDQGELGGLTYQGWK